MPLNATGLNALVTGGLGNTITHLGLHTLTDPGTATNAAAGEATGGSPAYARLVAAWAAAAAGARANSGALSWNAPAGTYGFVTFWNALTGNTNNYLGYAHLNNTVRGFGTVDAADVTANTVTSAGHGMANAQRVMAYNVFAESLPAGLTEGTIYHVVGATTDTFQVSLTSGGAAVDITGIGEMVFYNLLPETFAVDGTLNIAAGALVLDGVVI
jgi:hypothetical protein